MQPAFVKQNLVNGQQYILQFWSCCPAMNSTVTRVFVGFTIEGEPLFYDNSMNTSVIYDNSWSISI